MTADKPKRKAAGAAVPGAVDRPVNYPATVITMVSEDTKEAIRKTADANGVKMSVVARDWLEAGRKSSDVRFIDES